MNLRMWIGSAEAAWGHLAHEGRSPSRIVVHHDRASAIPWCIVRELFAALQERHEDAAVDAAVRPNRALLSLCLRGLDPTLDSSERAARDAHGAHLLGFLSHNGVVRAPLVRAWSRTLALLLGEDAVSVVIPAATSMDRESLFVVHDLLRHAPRSASFVLGHDPELAPSDWHARRTVALVANHLSDLERIADEVVALEGVGDDRGASALRRVRPAASPFDDLLEEGAWRELSADSGDVSPSAAQRVLAACRASFRAVAFGPALGLGLALLERAPYLPPDVTCELHTVVALSAYNRQVETEGDEELVDFLEHHFAAALALERSSARRSHLLYRLSLNRARRAGAFERAVELAGEALSAARDPAVPHGLGPYLEAWARNGRAYAHARLGRMNDALDDCRVAIARLEACPPDGGAPQNELPGTRAVLIGNLIELHARLGARAEIARLQDAHESACIAAFGHVPAFASRRRIDLQRDDWDLDGAIDSASDALARAHADLDPVSEELAARELGDLYLRRGDAVEALAQLRRVRRLCARSTNLARRFEVDVACALAAWRAGDFDSALEAFDAVRASEFCDESVTRADVFAASARCAATAGRAVEAERWLNEAIAAAVETGTRDTLLAVARAAGDACAALGRAEEASAAYRRALELADEHGEHASRPVDLVGSILGLLQQGEGAVSLVERALALMPSALADEEAWWDLDRLVRACTPFVPVLNSDQIDVLEWLARLNARRSGSRSATNGAN